MYRMSCFGSARVNMTAARARDVKSCMLTTDRSHLQVPRPAAAPEPRREQSRSGFHPRQLQRRRARQRGATLRRAFHHGGQLRCPRDVRPVPRAGPGLRGPRTPCRQGGDAWAQRPCQRCGRGPPCAVIRSGTAPPSALVPSRAGLPRLRASSCPGHVHARGPHRAGVCNPNQARVSPRPHPCHPTTPAP